MKKRIKPSITYGQWLTVLRRWSQYPDMPETELVCHMLADSIIQEQQSLRRAWTEPFVEGFFSPGGGFDLYCELLGIDPSFVRQGLNKIRDLEAEQE